MNSLSWFLYAADILPDVFKPVLIISGGVLVAIIIIAFALYASGVDDQSYDSFKEKGIKRAVAGKDLLVKLIPYVCVWLFLLTAQQLIPSRETFYLIAGSEIGEQVIVSPEAKEIFEDIKTVIKQQINKDK